MSYSALVKQQVKNAFKLAGDLVKTATLIQKDSVDFNFGTSAINAVTQASQTIEVIINKKKRDQEKGNESLSNAIEMSLLLDSSDIDDLSVYDRITIDGVVWQISFPVDNDGYTTTVSVTRTA